MRNDKRGMGLMKNSFGDKRGTKTRFERNSLEYVKEEEDNGTRRGIFPHKQRCQRSLVSNKG